MPCTKNLYEICEGIYIAQQEGDLVKEKQLFDLLIMLYRSPEALIKISGTDVEYAKDESDSKSREETNYSDRKTLKGSGSSIASFRVKGANNEGGAQNEGLKEGGSQSMMEKESNHAKQD